MKRSRKLAGALAAIGHWCMAASNFTGNSPTRLVAEPCEPTDTRQLWNLG